MTPTGSAGSAVTATAADPAASVRAKALEILNRAPQSCDQLRQKLLAKGAEPDQVETLIVRYLEVGLLDDAALAASIARTRHRDKGESRMAISMELRRKGFELADIDAALDQISPFDEREAASDLARRRWERLANVSVETRIRRVVSMLGRKGYSASLAYEIVQQLARADSDSA